MLYASALLLLYLSINSNYCRNSTYASQDILLNCNCSEILYLYKASNIPSINLNYINLSSVVISSMARIFKLTKSGSLS